MAIQRTFNASPEVLGRAARRAGQLSRIERDVDRRREDVKFAAQLGQRKKEFRANLGLRIGQQQLAKRQQGFREAATGAQITQRTRDQEFRQRVFEEEPARHLERAIQERDLERENYVWQFNEQQTRDQQKLNDAITWVQAESGWTSPEKQNAIQQLIKRHNNILPQWGPDTRPSPQKLMKSRMVSMDDGKVYYFPPDGNKPIWLNESETKILAEQKKAELANEQKIEAQSIKSESDLNSDRIKFFIEQGKVKKVVVVGSGENALNEEVPAFTFEEINDRWNQISGTTPSEEVTQPSAIAATIRSDPQAYLLDRIREGVDQATIEEAKRILANPNTTDAQLERMDQLLRQG